MNVLVGYTGQKSLGHAGLFAVGAYTVALLTARWGWNPWPAFAAAGVMAGIFGVVIALPALRVKGPALAMVTIGFGIVVEKIVSEWQDVFAGQQGIYGVLPLSLGGTMFSSKHWVWFVLLLGVALHVMLRLLLRGRFGRAFMAVNTAEVAAESVGISVYRFKVLAFVISAVTCGLAGALIAQQNQYINSDFITFNLSVFILLMVLFGGHSVYGPLLGAVVLTLLDAFLSRWPGVQHFTYGALLLFALYAMPDGLAGFVKKMARQWAPRLLPPEVLPQQLAPWRPRGDAARSPGPVQGLRRCGADQQCGHQHPRRPRAFADRAQRRGQDHAAQHPLGHRAAGQGSHPLRRPGRDGPAALPHRPRGPGAHLPEPQAVRGHIGAGQRQARPARAHPHGLLRQPAGPGRQGRARRARRGAADPGRAGLA
jgi:ABC-type branched-subunit amino acid transport system permease subunit